MENTHQPSERRVLSENDISLTVNAAVESAKVGVTALVLLNQEPVAAIGAALVAGLGGALLKKQEVRISEWLRKWKSKTDQLSPENQSRLHANLESEAGERIFEESWRIAAGCVDPEKLDYLAELLTNGLASETINEHQTRRLLALVEDLDAVDFVLLQSNLSKNRAPQYQYLGESENTEQQSKFKEFRSKHTEVFKDEMAPQHPYAYGEMRAVPDLSSEEKEDEERKFREYNQATERHALFQNRIHNLVETGLLGTHNSYGTQVQTGLTPLGMALLKIVGLAPDNEWGNAEAMSAVDLAQRIKEERESNTRRLQERDKKQGEREKQAAEELEREARNFIYELQRHIR